MIFYFFNLSGISSEMVLVLVTKELNVALDKEDCYCKVFKLDCSEKKITIEDSERLFGW